MHQLDGSNRAPGPRKRAGCIALRCLEIALFAGSLYFLGAFAWPYLDAWSFQRTEGKRLREALAQQAGASQVEASPGRAAEPGAVIGLIEIPAREVSSLIVEGTEAGDLQHAVGRIPGTARFGEEGTVGLAGHRDTEFRGLRETQVGDTLRVTMLDGSYTYVVESTQVVDPTTLEVLEPVGYPSLALVTCYPFGFIGPAPCRYVVHAKQLTSALEPRGILTSG